MNTVDKILLAAVVVMLLFYLLAKLFKWLARLRLRHFEKKLEDAQRRLDELRILGVTMDDLKKKNNGSNPQLKT